MQLKPIVAAVGKFAKKNLPTILIIFGTTSLVGGGVLACKNTPEFVKEWEESKKAQTPETSKKEKIFAGAKIVAKHYGVPIAMGGAGVAAIAVANGQHLKRQAAAVALCALEKDKVKDLESAIVKTVGDKKADEIKTAAAQEGMNRVNANPNQPIVINGNAPFECMDSIFKRKFNCDYETVKQSFKDLDDMLRRNPFVSYNDWLELLGQETMDSRMDEFGWRGTGYFSDCPNEYDQVKLEPSSIFDEVTGQNTLYIGFSVEPEWDARGLKECWH